MARDAQFCTSAVQEVMCYQHLTHVPLSHAGDVIDDDAQAFERPPETLAGDTRELIRGAYELKGLVARAGHGARVRASRELQLTVANVGEGQ